MAVVAWYMPQIERSFPYTDTNISWKKEELRGLQVFSSNLDIHFVSAMAPVTVHVRTLTKHPGLTMR
jgi:hypothetical protein